MNLSDWTSEKKRAYCAAYAACVTVDERDELASEHGLNRAQAWNLWSRWHTQFRALGA